MITEHTTDPQAASSLVKIYGGYLISFLKDLGLTLVDISLWLVLIIVAIGATWDFLKHYQINLPLPQRWHTWLNRRSGHKETKELVREVFQELGYRPQAVSAARALIANRHYDVAPLTINQCYSALIVTLARYTSATNVEILYGRETPTRTRYYINSMAASHKLSDREIMAKLLIWLIAHSPDARPIDFVLVPKAGNPLLADQISQDRGYICLFSKSKREASRSEAAPSASPAARSINIEGFTQLLSYAAEQTHELNGVVVDCNLSGGSTHRDAVLEFNALIPEFDCKVRPLDRVYVLYRPDPSQLAQLEPGGTALDVRRFFDLTETLKEELYTLGQQPEGAGSPVHAGKVAEILTHLREQNLTRCD